MGAIIVGQVTKKVVQVKWDAETSLDIGDRVLLNTEASIIRSVTLSLPFPPKQTWEKIMINLYF